MSIYDHARKAGNRGDVWKHFVLLTAVDRLLDSLPRPGRPFRYCETHAGVGRFELREVGEWQQGIGAVLPAAADLAAHPYFRLVGETLAPGDRYLGSWRLVARHLEERRVDYRMRLFDTSTPVANLICSEIERSRLPRTISFQQIDGFDGLADRSGDGLTLVDPTYRPAQRDWRQARKAAALLAERGESYLVWYPIYWPTHPARLVAAAGASAFEVLWSPIGDRPSRRAKGCGMLAGGAAGGVLEAAVDELDRLASSLAGSLKIRRP